MYVLIRPSILLVISTDGVNKDVFGNSQYSSHKKQSHQPPNVITSINISQNQKLRFANTFLVFNLHREMLPLFLLRSLFQDSSAFRDFAFFLLFIPVAVVVRANIPFLKVHTSLRRLRSRCVVATMGSGIGSGVG
jgi:hypothetical protein